MVISDDFYMRLALNEAWRYQLLTYPNPAVGCVILDKNGRILAIKAHQKAGHPHAELNAITAALGEINPQFRDKFQLILQNRPTAPQIYEFVLNHHGGLLRGACAFVTLEPCAHHGRTPPCAALLKELGFSRVVVGAMDPIKGHGGGLEILKNTGMAVKTGVLKAEAMELLEPFLCWQNGSFSFFKIALSQNGVCTGGTISGPISHAHAHAVRSLADILVIGGQSVRTDRPTLDSRFAPIEADFYEWASGRVGGKSSAGCEDIAAAGGTAASGGDTGGKDSANGSTTSHTAASNAKNPPQNTAKSPDILIYSRRTDFDPNIPLFSISGREVSIASSLDGAFKRNFIIYEGGQNALKSLDSRINWLLIYRSGRFLDAPAAQLGLCIKTLATLPMGDDTLSFCKIIRPS